MRVNFDNLKTKDKKELLVKFLDEYSSWSFAERQRAMKVVVYKGIEFAMPWQEVCKRASDMLQINLIQSLKFEALVEQMKKSNLGHFYEVVMGQPISEALVK